MFQMRNARGDYQGSDLDRSGLGKSKSNSKPPLSGGRGQRGRSNDDEEEKGLYGNPYNVNGKVHPGVSN